MPAAPLVPLRTRWWIPVLIAALLTIAWDVRARLGHAAHVRTLTAQLTPAPAPDPSSPTGYAFGQRSVVLSDSGADGYHWIMHTQQMFATGEARIRQVNYDNAPNGRAVHWASLFRWWLAGLAWIDHATTGVPLAIATERAAAIASPVLLVLTMIGLVPLVARWMSDTAACLTTATLLGGRACYAYFLTGNPDHHGIAIAAAFLCVLGVVAGGGGCVRDDAAPQPGNPDKASPKCGYDSQSVADGADVRRARLGFRVSALAGGFGLWNSASTQIQVLVGIGLGALVAILFLRSRAVTTRWRPMPELWRLWGAWGAGTSLVAYAIEYLPSDVSMRLEVNHPLHALAWLGAGELLCRIWRILDPATRSRRSRDVPAIALAAMLVMLPPAAVVLGGREVFVIADRFYTLLSVSFTSEGQSLFEHLRSGSLAGTAAAMALPGLVLLPVGLVLVRRETPAPVRARLGVSFAATLVLFAWGAAEIRWLGIAVALLPIAWADAVTHAPSAMLRRAGLASALLLIPGLWVTLHYTPRDFTHPELYRIVERDIAHWLRRRTGAGPLVVGAGPGRTSSFIYYGGARGLGTFYWENREGIERAAALFRASTEEEARALVRSHGITHLVLPAWDRFEQVVRAVDARLHPGSADAEPFIHRVARTKVLPQWLRPLPYPVLKHELLAGESVLVLEVDDDAPPAASADRLAQFLLETGQTGAALKLLPALQRAPLHLPSLITATRVLQENGRDTEVLAALGTLADAYAASPALAAEDHLRLAVVLARARQGGPARAELERGLVGLDEPSLRRLTPMTLAETLVLLEAFGAPPAADPQLMDLVRELAP